MRRMNARTEREAATVSSSLSRLTKGFKAMAAVGIAVQCLLSGGRGEERQELMALTIEELMDVEVVSVTRSKGQRLMESPAAIFVICQEDIKRSGVTSIPDALRMVPGLHVARVDASRWSVASRGFGSRWHPMMLVQVDGRTVYSPAFSGVLWEAMDLPLEDIDRIEVIRGPGATLWGANAVNGIINIVTKQPEETRGGLASVACGTEERGLASFRFGAGREGLLDFRIFGKCRAHDDFDTFGAEYSDDWESAVAGFRLDAYPGERDLATLQGHIHRGDYGSSAAFPDLTKGAMLSEEANWTVDDWDVTGRWTHEVTEDSAMQFQVYYDRMRYRMDAHAPRDDAGVEHGTVDLDLQHNLSFWERNELVWGVEYRRASFDLDSSPKVSWQKSELAIETYSVFLQNTVAWIPETLFVTLGTKMEDNDQTDFEFQPTARLAWTPSDRHTVWASLSRSVRVPSIAYQYITIAHDVARLPLNARPLDEPSELGVPVQLSIVGDADLRSEVCYAYEMGYRTSVTEALSLDITGYFNHYEGVIEQDLSTPPTFTFENRGVAETHGLEVAADWRIADIWRVTASYTWFDMWNGKGWGSFPEHQVSMLSEVDVTKDLTLHTAAYYVDDIVNRDWNVIAPEYVRVDLGLTWRLLDNLEIALWGQNVLEGGHSEFAPEGIITNSGSEVERGVYGMVTCRF